jgi:hypothetical protein
VSDDLPPTGFWVYTHSDDQASGGRLSQLRKQLAQELQYKLGDRQRVDIWQDLSKIDPGSDWLDETAKAIEKSSFCIPILTPAFWRSVSCAREVIQFREIERGRGRNDLIFPIVYDPISMRLDKDAHDPWVFNLLSRRHWADFSNLRQLNPEDGAFAKVLDRFTAAIAQALVRKAPTTRAPPVSERELQRVSVQSSRGIVFASDPSGPIRMIVPEGEHILDTLDQRQTHADIRKKAQELVEICGNSNYLSRLKGRVLKLLESCGTQIDDLKSRAFWSDMNGLRRHQEADQKIRSDTESNEPVLPHSVASDLADLVDTLNLFAASDPVISDLDRRMLDPSVQASTPERQAAARQINAAAAAIPEAVSPDTTSLIDDVAQDAIGPGPSADRAREFVVESIRNMCVETLRRVYKAVLTEGAAAIKGVKEGTYRGIGATVGTGAILTALAFLIRTNEASIRVMIDSLGGASTFHKIIDLIVKFTW